MSLPNSRAFHRVRISRPSFDLTDQARRSLPVLLTKERAIDENYRVNVLELLFGLILTVAQIL
jgi:hypothetical protein